MENRITFRIENELSEQLNSYCSDNKLSKTETMNIAVKKLISGQDGGITNDKIMDEIFLLARTHLLLYRNFSVNRPDNEINAALKKISDDSAAVLEKIKKGGK